MWELRVFSGFSWAFVHPWVCAQTYACTLPSIYPGKCQIFSKHPAAISFSRLAFWGFFGQLVVCPSFYQHLRQPWCNSITTDCFWQMSPFTLGEFQLRSNKDKFVIGEPLDRSVNDKSLGMGLWRSFMPIMSPPMAVSVLAFTFVMGCWFPRLHRAGEEGWEYCQLKCYIICCSYQDSGVFLECSLN